ncbi:hypothetical protein ACTMTJ_42610 [Phytohabitans sp. LJ34]|uniref:hypothetical protein n=1 Tax=Phytohabitans sp. LJ34 TaxID=3452217 RepID=UPI003F8C6766
MKRNTPLITLVVGAAVAAGVFISSAYANNSQPEPPAQQAAPPVQSPTTAPAPPVVDTAPPVVAASPTAAAEKVTAVWAGRTDGGAASVAISVKEGVAIAYVCDGKREMWLEGTAIDGKITLSGANGTTLTGTFGGGKAKGTVSQDKTTYTFTAPAVKKPSGLYRATATVRNAKVVGGWIVLPDGSQVGLVTRDGVPQPAAAIDPATGAVTIDGVPLTADYLQGGQR